MYYLRTIIPRDADSYQVIMRDAAYGGGQIPINEVNADYKQYLAWLAEGNTPEEWQAE